MHKFYCPYLNLFSSLIFSFLFYEAGYNFSMHNHQDLSQIFEMRILLYFFNIARYLDCILINQTVENINYYLV